MSDFIPPAAQMLSGSHQHSPIEVLDNEAPGVIPHPWYPEGFDQRNFDNYRAARDNVENHHHPDAASPVDSTHDDDDGLQELKDEEALSRDMPAIDLTDHDDVPRHRGAVERPARNANLDETHEPLDSYHHGAIQLKVKQTVELTERLGVHFVEFLKIESIHKDKLTGKVLLRGIPYCRSRYLGGYLHRKANEVVAIWEVDDDDPRDSRAQALLEVPAEAVKVERTLITTNKPFPAHRYEIMSYPDIQQAQKDAHLVCRWEHFIHYRDAAKRKIQKAYSWVLRHTTEDQVPKAIHRTKDEVRLNRWRGGKIPGGSYVPSGPVGPVVDVDVDTVSGRRASGSCREPIEGQRYTFGDAFSGAGGASRGAKMANFKLDVAVDHWDNACKTYRLNFPDTELHQMDIFDFITNLAHRHRVDILHISPPCQPYSPAHTVDGQNDAANIAALYSCTELIAKVRPRIFTVEQTFGILHEKSKYYFAALIEGFARHGYSVRWKVVHLKTWGLPQVRRRLIMIGSCPGEPLPPFPQLTHSEAAPRDGLRPFVTAREALRGIPRGATHHNPAAARRRCEPPWDEDAPLPRTITTSGGQNYHYSGRRDLTAREFAALQGFPHYHLFYESCIKRQIGNAFPPCVVKVLYDHLRRWLQQVDGVSPAPEVMDLTEEPDDLPAPDAEGPMDLAREYMGDLSEDEALRLAVLESQEEHDASTSGSEPMVIDLDDYLSEFDAESTEQANDASIEDEAARLRRVEAQMERTSISSPEPGGPQSWLQTSLIDLDDDGDDSMDDDDGQWSRTARSVSVASSVTIDGAQEAPEIIDVHQAMEMDEDENEIAFMGSSPVCKSNQVIALDD
ncbi:C-5 cytosine-specific DNA methylase [Pleurostoma richardsiae]|uniref:DNA (cytosine-5-)-methyltransferase n=1 Tax=Pleurostoma richardsiae TaxID=41990 RepID=A0AA38RY26_9PEZI|nr:C-5 cytosine-specific DNA methylase [Pleurostoma richardsiae]